MSYLHSVHGGTQKVMDEGQSGDFRFLTFEVDGQSVAAVSCRCLRRLARNDSVQFSSKIARVLRQESFVRVCVRGCAYS